MSETGPVQNQLDAFLTFVSGGTSPKIRAIKFIRDSLGCSLSVAKDRFEAAFPSVGTSDYRRDAAEVEKAQDAARKALADNQVLRSALQAEEEHEGVLRAQIHRLASLLHLIGVDAETVRRIAPAADFTERRIG